MAQTSCGRVKVCFFSLFCVCIIVLLARKITFTNMPHESILAVYDIYLLVHRRPHAAREERISTLRAVVSCRWLVAAVCK